MTESKKAEINAIISDKLIQAIKARIIRTCVAENDIKEADIFRDYINSLNRDETMFLWDTVKALGWIDFINCMNDNLGGIDRCSDLHTVLTGEWSNEEIVEAISTVKPIIPKNY